MNAQKTAAAYIRVSTDRQEELSPDAQKRELLNYARKNGILITDIYQDNGISGRNAEKRPEFQKMISLAKSAEHPYDCILVWKFSRFARNQEESIVYKSLLQKNNVDVVSITEPLVDGPFASLIERIIEWMDEYYSIRLASDVRRGMMEKALRGGYQSAPPLGYTKTSDIPDIYEPDAIIIREIFRLCKEGYHLTTIARMINDAGYKTRRGNRFERRTILYILQNPFYCGMVRWNRTKHNQYHINDENEIVIAKGVHEPLFTEAYFDEIQNIVQKYTSGHTGIQRRKSETLYKHYLCGIMKCPICGKNLAYHCTKEKKHPEKPYAYFVCWQYSKGYHKIGGNISARRCEEALKKSLQCILGTDTDAIKFLPNKKRKVPSPLLKKYKTALEKLDQKERRIRAAYMENIDSKDEYRENKLLLSRERSELEQLISAEENNATKKLPMQIKDMLQILEDPATNTVKKHQAFASILVQVEYERNTDCFRFYYLFS